MGGNVFTNDTKITAREQISGLWIRFLFLYVVIIGEAVVELCRFTQAIEIAGMKSMFVVPESGPYGRRTWVDDIC